MGRSACVDDSLLAGESLFMKISGSGDFVLPELLGEREHCKPPCRDFIGINTGLVLEVLFSKSESFYHTNEIFKMQY